MARYRSFGGLDDAIVEDGDVGFTGMNLRLPPWQLRPGELAMSQNGRIDGHWVPRRGVDVVTVGSLVSGSPLRLPFWLVDDSGGVAVTAAELSGNVVTLTATGHGLPVGSGSVEAVLDPSGANNEILLTGIGGLESGVAGVDIQESPSGGYFDEVVDLAIQEASPFFSIRPAYKYRMTVAGTLTPDATGSYIYAGLYNSCHSWTSDGNSSPAPSGYWYRICSDSSILYAEGWVIQVFFDGFILNGQGWTAGYLETDGTYPDGRQFDKEGGGNPATVTAELCTASDVITLINATSGINALMVASNAAGSDGSGEIGYVPGTYLEGVGESESAYLGVEGLGFATTDPNGVQLVTPTSANTLTYDLTGANEVYTAGGGDVVRSVLDDFATEELLGACLFSDPSSDNAEYIMLAYGLEVKKVKLSDGSVSSLTLPGSETIDSQVHMVQAMDKVLLFRPGLVAMQWVSGDSAFTLVPYGAYTQPQVLLSSAAAVSSGSVTFTVTGNTTIAVGDWVTIYDTTDARFASYIGQQFECTSITSTTTVVLQMPVANSASAASATQIGKSVSVGGGFIHQPGFPWAVYFQRRIWGPYEYFWDTSLTPDAFSPRDIHDELIAGDILDSDTFDAISNQFRITGGVADYLVGLHPFFDDTLLVFMRNSIHAISGTVGSLLDTSVRELTREIGCVARKSIVSQGNSVFFLSDNGVYGLEFQDLYNLRGVERPLSENIQPLIDRISRDLAGDAVAAYFNNRYWIAVPLDTLPRQGDAKGNNAILVYNLLNRSWESVDTFGDPEFLITDLLIGSAGARNDLYAVTRAGGIHILDDLDRAFDQIASNPSVGVQNFEIDATMTSRGLLCSTLERKRFAEMGVQMKSGVDFSDIGITFSSDDPDSTGDEVAASDTLGEYVDAENSADIRARIGGERGFHGTVTVRRLVGRPYVSGVKISATVANRAVISQK